MPFRGESIVLTPEEQEELQQMCQSRTLPAGDVLSGMPLFHQSGDAVCEEALLLKGNSRRGHVQPFADVRVAAPRREHQNQPRPE